MKRLEDELLGIPDFEAPELDTPVVDDFAAQAIQAAPTPIERVSPFEPNTEPLIIEEREKPTDIIARLRAAQAAAAETQQKDYGDADERSRKMQLYGNLLSGFNSMIKNSMATVVPNFQADMSVADNLRGQGKDAMADYYKKIQNARDTKAAEAANMKNELGLDSDAINLEYSQDMSNPLSAAARGLDEAILRISPKFDRSQLKNMTPRQKMDILNPLAKAADVENSRDLKWAALTDKKEAREETAKAKLEAQTEKDVQKLMTNVTGGQDLLNSYNEVEANLGAPLDQFDASGSELKRIDGSKVDLPGISLPGVGRVTAYDDKAQRLKASMDKIFNITLKDRSGAAVTDNEMQRLKDEYQSGKFNTEAQMIDAAQRYKAAAVNAMRNKESAFKPEVREVYKERGGILSDSFGLPTAPQTNKVRVISPDGKIKLVPKEQLDAAIKAGGKLADVQ